MNFVQVYTSKDEMDAAITKGYLESLGIKASISPENRTFISRYLTYPMGPHAVYVEKEKVEEAKKVLAERK